MVVYVVGNQARIVAVVDRPGVPVDGTGGSPVPEHQFRGTALGVRCLDVPHGERLANRRCPEWQEASPIGLAEAQYASQALNVMQDRPPHLAFTQGRPLQDAAVGDGQVVCVVAAHGSLLVWLGVFILAGGCGVGGNRAGACRLARRRGGGSRCAVSSGC